MYPNDLKRFRKNKKISQSQLGKMLGVTNDYISAIERGSRTPSLKLAKKMADCFGVTVDKLFFNT